MPASDGLDMFYIITNHPLHHIISVYTPLFLTSSICIDGEVLESMVALVQALSVSTCVCVCGVLVLEKCSSCRGNTGTKRKQCYFEMCKPEDGSELYTLWMGGGDGWLIC